MVDQLVEIFGSSDDLHQRSSHVRFDNDAACHSYYDEASVEKLCSHWFSEGVSLGRQLQRDDDEERLCRYKVRMRAQAIKCEEEVLLQKRYREEMQLLQAELLTLRDEVFVVRTAYEELALSISTSDSSSNPERDGSMNYTFEFESSASRKLGDAEYDFQTLQQLMERDIDCDQPIDDVEQSRLPVGFDTFESSPPLYSEASSSGFGVPNAQVSCKPGEVQDDSMSSAQGGDLLQRIRIPNQAAERTPKPQRAQAHLVTVAPPSPESPEIFVDASAHGIGFIFNDRWLAWKFTSAYPLGPDGKLIMSWAELVAVEMGIRTLIAASFRNVTITVHSDNQGVVTALQSGKWTKKFGLNDIVKGIFDLCLKAGLSLRMKWIWTKENPADNPSRGVYPPTELAFQSRPSIPCNLCELIQDVG